MFTNFKNKSYESELYNKIVSLSRNKFFYTKFNLEDSFSNRIVLIFIHTAFLLIKLKKNYPHNKNFNQNFFDIIFTKIEINIREIGFGDVKVNKDMKLLVKKFYEILFKCESYGNLSYENKEIFFNTYLDKNKTNKSLDIDGLGHYFTQYKAFCFDLRPDSVLKGELNFNYKQIDK
tara:strand:- start:1295 stop:1822 length:528 start_codon:yes stop_codon:yes gene_type:complete